MDMDIKEVIYSSLILYISISILKLIFGKNSSILMFGLSVLILLILILNNLINIRLFRNIRLFNLF